MNKVVVLLATLFLFTSTSAKSIISFNPGDVILDTDAVGGQIGDNLAVGGAIVGGFTDWQPATPEIQSICDELRTDVEMRMNMMTSSFTSYVAVSYRSQVVAGTNYVIRMDVGEEQYLELNVFETLPIPQSMLSLTSAQWVEDEADEGPELNLGDNLVVGGAIVGGFTDWQPATPEIQSICDELRTDVEMRMNMMTSSFTSYVAVSYRSQVVAGTNYVIRMDVGEEQYLELNVFETLPIPQFMLSLTSAQWVEDEAEIQSTDDDGAMETFFDGMPCFLKELFKLFKRA